MLKKRIIPCLLLEGESLVKTTRFKKPKYIGDSINTVRIFNELEVDELLFLDIYATKEKREPNYDLLEEIANECFMPLAYGGGITSVDQARRILSIGFEKVAINAASFQNPKLISDLAESFGSQSVIISIDVRKNLWGKFEVCSHNATKKQSKNAVEWAQELEKLGAGELLVTSVQQEGTWDGFDVKLISAVAQAVNIPVIGHGGAGNIDDIKQVLTQTKASAVGLGSMVVYQNKGMGVLVNFPDRSTIQAFL